MVFRCEDPAQERPEPLPVLPTPAQSEVGAQVGIVGIVGIKVEAVAEPQAVRRRKAGSAGGKAKPAKVRSNEPKLAAAKAKEAKSKAKLNDPKSNDTKSKDTKSKDTKAKAAKVKRRKKNKRKTGH
jgi:hypothetical protein